MKRLSLEKVVDRWSVAHTVALAAWAVVSVLGILLAARHTRDSYPATDKSKIYAGENATFYYPENWTINNCEGDKHFIELPGTIKSTYKGRHAYPFTMYGMAAYECIKDRPQRFDIHPEEIVASEKPCSIATSTKGKRLDNGLYLQLAEDKDGVFGIVIRQNNCFAPPESSVLAFAFTDPAADTGLQTIPRINKDVLLASRQYQDIKTLAEGIKY